MIRTTRAFSWSSVCWRFRGLSSGMITADPERHAPSALTRTRGLARRFLTYWACSPNSATNQNVSPARPLPTGFWRGDPGGAPNRLQHGVAIAPVTGGPEHHRVGDFPLEEAEDPAFEPAPLPVLLGPGGNAIAIMASTKNRACHGRSGELGAKW